MSAIQSGLATKWLRALAQDCPFLRYMGLAPWGAGADMAFDHGRLCLLNYSVGTIGTGLSKMTESFEIRAEESSTAKTEYMIGGGGSASRRILQVNIPSDATSEERGRAFAFHLSCLTRLGGCRTVCDVLPLKPIWQDFVARNPGIAIPSAVLTDPFCSRQ
jgi:hypothetical protein